MKIILFKLSVFGFLTFSIAQNICLTNRVTQQNIFVYDKNNPLQSQIACDSAKYGENFDWLGVLKELKFNIWYPKSNVDTFSRRPFIVVIHGGGFTGGNRYQKDSICLSLACKGMVAAAIDYRKGKQNGNAQSGYNAQYRAFQDALASLRYFRHHYATYKIDTTAMFIAGSSAGGITALHAAFMSQTEADSDPEYQNCHYNQQLGHLDSATCSYYLKPRIRGVINMWGGITDTAYIGFSDKKPVLLIHGEKDQSVSINTFQMAGTYYGSRPISFRLKNLGECYRFLVDKNGGHGGYGNPNSPLPKEEWKARQIACFVRDVLCNACPLNAQEDTLLSSPVCNTVSMLNNNLADDKHEYFSFLSISSKEVRIISSLNLNEEIRSMDVLSIEGKKLNFETVNNSDHSVILIFKESIENKLLILDLKTKSGKKYIKKFKG
ncbi:MAG: alpha/beta hydrolase fold domain-containing protein [Bacteroidia bacterium]|nr:alpha/beta hydrolase fold domain-containing protein [Bacteroidia bacterium]